MLLAEPAPLGSYFGKIKGLAYSGAFVYAIVSGLSRRALIWNFAGEDFFKSATWYEQSATNTQHREIPASQSLMHGPEGQAGLMRRFAHR